MCDPTNYNIVVSTLNLFFKFKNVKKIFFLNNFKLDFEKLVLKKCVFFLSNGCCVVSYVLNKLYLIFLHKMY